MTELENNGNVVNLIASVYWSIALIASVVSKKIPYTIRLDPISVAWLERRKSPRLFWFVVAGMGLAAIWTGAVFLLRQM